MKNKKMIILVILLVVLIGGGTLGYNFLVNGQTGQGDAGSGDGSGQQSGQQENSFEPFEAVDFYVYDGDGEKIYLSDFKGKPVIVNFWATWCGPCRMEFPAFETAYEQYGDEVEFLMINQTDGQRDTVESVKSFVEENELDFPVYFDSDLIATQTYGVYSIPLTFMVDEEGYVVNAHIGAISEEALLDFLGK